MGNINTPQSGEKIDSSQKLEQSVSEARDQVRNSEMKAQEEQQEKSTLEQELREAQTAELQRKEAEDRSKETKEKINEATGEK